MFSNQLAHDLLCYTGVSRYKLCTLITKELPSYHNFRHFVVPFIWRHILYNIIMILMRLVMLFHKQLYQSLSMYPCSLNEYTYNDTNASGDVIL